MSVRWSATSWRLGLVSACRQEHFPGDVPELNPDEGVWHYLKYVELCNMVYRNPGELRQHLGRAVNPLRQQVRVLFACPRQPELDMPAGA